jgi:hypothetical protein
VFNYVLRKTWASRCTTRTWLQGYRRWCIIDREIRGSGLEDPVSSSSAEPDRRIGVGTGRGPSARQVTRALRGRSI